MWMKIIGHRGAMGLAAENSLAAIRKSLEYDIDEVEFDLRMTSDGVIVLHHYPSFKTKSGKRISIVNSTYKEIKKYKPTLTTFDEAMKLINHQVAVLIEVKPGVKTEQIISRVRYYLKHGWKTSDIVMESRDQKVLLQLHKAFPQLKMVVVEHWSGTRAMWKAHQVKTNRITLSRIWLWQGLIWSLNKRGWEIYPYTMNNPEKAKKWSRAGITGIITDHPERFVTKKTR
jgi:glycerophosphoryl diester phosphodiesterase